MTKKGNIWYIHDFSKAVGNTIKASCRFNAAVLPIFDISITICFLLLLILRVTKLLFPQFRFPHYKPLLGSPHFYFCDAAEKRF